MYACDKGKKAAAVANMSLMTEHWLKVMGKSTLTFPACLKKFKY